MGRLSYLVADNAEPVEQILHCLIHAHGSPVHLEHRTSLEIIFNSSLYMLLLHTITHEDPSRVATAATNKTRKP
jgi:hypothetical protein